MIESAYNMNDEKHFQHEHQLCSVIIKHQNIFSKHEI